MIPDSVTKITPNAFYGFNAASVAVEFGSNTLISEIGARAFKDVKVSTLTITGRNQLTIGEETFIGTSLANVKITNVNAVGTRAFYHLATLVRADLTFTGANAVIGESAFELATYGNTQSSSVLVVRGTLAEISANAFKNNDIGNWKFDDVKVLTIGESAFYYAAVTSVPTNVVTIGDYAYEGANILKNGAGNVVVLDVESIGKAAFRNSTITGFTFGSKLRTVYADNASNEGSFNKTASLASITYGGGDVSNPRFGVKKNVLYSKDEENGRYVALKFAEKADGRVGDLSLLTEIGYGAFRDSLVSKASFDVIKIGDCAFENCRQIVCVNNTKSEGLIFGSGLSEIGENAFKGCNKIMKIELQGLAALTVRENAFKGCTALKEVYVSATQLHIEEGVFTGASISTITLDSRYITIDDALMVSVAFVPFYGTAEATAVSSKISADHIVFYTPTECLVVNEDGKFCGASSGCSLHEDHKHNIVYLPIYHSAYKRIVGIFADENKLLDGDGTELQEVDYVYGYTYVYFNGSEYVTAVMGQFTDLVPTYVYAFDLATADPVIGLN